MKKENEAHLYRLPLIVSVLIFLIGAVAGIKELWGVNFLKFFGAPAAWTAAGLVLVCAIPSVGKKLSALPAAGSEWAFAFRFVLIVTLVLFPLFLLLAPPLTLLGDSTLRINQIYNKQLFLPTEAGDFFLHATTFRLIFEPLGFDVVKAYHVISALCGVIFIIGSFRLARYLSRLQWLLLFLLMLSSGIMVLFFGYVESYSLIAALLPFIFLSGLKAADGAVSKINFIGWCLAGVLVHVVSVFIFVPALFLLLVTSPSENDKRLRKLSHLFLAGLTAVIAAVYVVRHLDLFDVARYVLPWFVGGKYQQGIFTFHHYLNLFNWTFLSALPLLFLAPYFLRSVKASDLWSSRRNVFLLWLAIPSLCFVFFFTPQLGGPRDWDLFTLPLYVVMLAALAFYAADRKHLWPPQMVPLIVLSLVITGSFVAVNRSVSKSVERFQEIIEINHFKNLTKEYSSLYGYTLHQPDIASRRLEFLHKAWQQPPYNKTDSVTILFGLAMTYLERGDRQRSLGSINLALSVDSLDLNTYIALMDYQRKYAGTEELLETAALVARRFPNKARGQTTAGATFLQLGQTELGGNCLERAYQLDSSDSPVVFNWGLYRYQMNDYVSAARILEKAAQLNRRNFSVYYYLSLIYHKLGNREKFTASRAMAEKLAGSASEKQMLQDIPKSPR